MRSASFVHDANPRKVGLPAKSSDMLQLPGQTFDVKISMEPGSYYLHCDPHALLGMRGESSSSGFTPRVSSLLRAASMPDQTFLCDEAHIKPSANPLLSPLSPPADWGASIKMKILIVDDDPVSRETAHRVARQIVDTVLLAANGEEALMVIERELPDLVITDLRLPQMDGVAMIQALRASPVFARIPVICLTAVDDRKEIERLASLDITDYILKPVGAVQLAQRLRRAVRRRVRQARATRTARR
jgi:CheY-like chemotaxis protein